MIILDTAVEKLNIHLRDILERKVPVLVGVHVKEDTFPKIEAKDYANNITYRIALLRQQREALSRAKNMLIPKLEQLGLVVIGGPSNLSAIHAHGSLRAILEVAHLPEVRNIITDSAH
jgi:hypothetical protein